MNDSNDLKLITPGLISVAGKSTMKHKRIQQKKIYRRNRHRYDSRKNREKEDNVKDLFSKSFCFTEMERTRKYKEGRYQLIAKKVEVHRS